MYFFYLEKCDKENTERDITQATDSCFTHGEMQDQSIWGNCSNDELIRSKYFWRKLECFGDMTMILCSQLIV